MYAGDELITFAQIEIPDTKISLFLPEQFVLMPEESKAGKISIAGRTGLYFYQFRFHSKYLY